MRLWLWVVVGVASLGLGAWLVLTTSGAAEFGWFAYTPLDDRVEFDGNAIILSRTQAIGYAIGVFGLVVVAGGAGYRVGQSRWRQGTDR